MCVCDSSSAAAQQQHNNSMVVVVLVDLYIYILSMIGACGVEPLLS